MQRRNGRRWRTCAAAIAMLFAVSAIHAQNIDPGNDGARFVYGENAGWVNFKPAAAGVTITGTTASGFAYAENVGWLNLAPAGGGVRNDGAGRLSGFAYGENVGWINFGPIGSGVRINACGEFSGLAYGENIGWISFGPGEHFDLRTAWVSPVDDVAPHTVASVSKPNDSGWYHNSVTVALAATDCGPGVREIHTRLDARPEVISAGNTTSVMVANEGIHTVSLFAVDQANNAETAQSLQLRIDKTAPQIAIDSPAQEAVFAINETVPAAFTVADAHSGVSFVAYTVASGAPIPTSIAGLHVFSVQAGDKAGNEATVTRNYTVRYPGNIDPQDAGQEFAYGENIGWLNFQPPWGPGVMVTRTAVRGFAYAENVGWINLGPSNGGIANDGTGKLTGFAYGENVGWINFGPQGGGVTIDAVTGRFSGFAYSENVGWINLGATGSALITSWRAADTAAPVVTPPAGTMVPATEAGGARANDSKALAAFLASGTATDNLDPQPVRLIPQVGGVSIGATTLFPNRSTPVLFRFQDRSGNIGTASADVTVSLGQARLVGAIAGTGMEDGAFYVDLKLSNAGTGNARQLLLTELLSRTLSGSGAVSLDRARSPSFPIAIGSLDVGQAVTVRIFLDIPATVGRFSLTENGTLRDVAGTTYRYSIGQSIMP
jgi:hypothetical protein